MERMLNWRLNIHSILFLLLNILTLAIWFGSIDPVWHKGLSLALNLWEKYIYLYLTLLQPENFSKAQK